MSIFNHDYFIKMNDSNLNYDNGVENLSKFKYKFLCNKCLLSNILLPYSNIFFPFYGYRVFLYYLPKLLRNNEYYKYYLRK